MTDPKPPLTFNAPLVVPFKRLTADAVLPTKAHPGDAAFDLRSNYSVHIQPQSADVIPTGLAWEGPDGWYAQILTRSSHAKEGLVVVGGVIDSGYRGEWKVIIYNGNDVYYHLPEGTRVAQFVILPVPQIQIVDVESLGETERGEGGFGSTGE